MKYGEWEDEMRNREDGERGSSSALRLYTGNDIESGDIWMCKNPWTGISVAGKMR
jgi:hypothetical protein